MVRGVAVVLDVLALLPDAEVVERRRSVEAHRRPFLFTGTHRARLPLLECGRNHGRGAHVALRLQHNCGHCF